MSTLLLDAGVILAAFDPDDEHCAPARSLLADAETTLATLDLARYELVDVAVRVWRSPASIGPLLAAVERIADDGGVVVSTDSLLRSAAELAERHAISIYDAAYVAAAREGDRELVSCDRRDLLRKRLAVPPTSFPRGSRA